MKPSTKKQIINGLRMGAGIGAFWVAAMLIGIGMDGLQSKAPGQLRWWPDGAIVGGLFALATVFLVLTARVWVIYLAGCLLFAIPKVVTVIVSGRSFYSPHGPFSPVEAAELLFFFLVSLFLMYRVSVNHAPTVFERLVLTFYLVSFVPTSSGHFSLVAPWQIIGLTSLFVAWYLSRKKRRRHRLSSIPTSE